MQIGLKYISTKRLPAHLSLKNKPSEQLATKTAHLNRKFMSSEQLATKTAHLSLKIEAK